MRTTPILAISLTIIGFVAFSGQTLPAEETERFGLKMGMKKAEVIASVGPNAAEEDLGDVLILATAPKPDAHFVQYVVFVPPETGVIKIVAISSDVTTKSSGETLRDKFNELRSSLEADHGKAALLFDFLIPGSDWNEPGDWMIALLNHERTLMAGWEPDEEGVSLAEKACAIDPQTGYVMVTYEFPNFVFWKQEHRGDQDEFLKPKRGNGLVARMEP